MPSMWHIVLSLKVVFHVSFDSTDLPELTTMHFGHDAFQCKDDALTTLIMRSAEMNVN